MTVVTYRSAGAGLWLCPAGVTQVALVECWGAGTGGNSGSPVTGGNAGGGGEYAAETGVAVTPGRLYRWGVGSAGSGAAGGGISSFAGDTVTVTAHGATAATGTSAGQGGRGSGNTVHHNGGSGGNANGTVYGGGGGSSAGTAAAGVNGGNATSAGGPGAGGAAPAGGGNGGQGGSQFIPAQVPAQPGHAPGGGGGAGGQGITNHGAPGAAGQVQITYPLAVQPQVPFFPAGYKPLNSDFDNWIQAPLSFLTSRIVFRAEQSASLSLTGGTTTLIPFNSILEDPFAGWEPGSSQWLCPPGYSGLYVVSLTVSCAPNTNLPVTGAVVGVNSLAQQYSVDRAWVPATSGRPGFASGEIPVRLYGGQDSVQGYARLVGANSSVATTAGQRCQMVITWQAL